KTYDCNGIVDRYGASPALTGYPRREPVLLTDDGLLLTAEQSLRITDTLVMDLVAMTPEPDSEGVSLESQVELRFTHPVVVPSAQSEADWLARYVALVREDGSSEGETVEADIH